MSEETDKKIAALKEELENKSKPNIHVPVVEELKPKKTNSILSELNWDSAELHLRKVKEFQLGFKGQNGHNPYLWLKQKLNDFEARFIDGERTPELHKAILDIPLAEPPTGAVIRGVNIPVLKDVLTPQGKIDSSKMPQS